MEVREEILSFVATAVLEQWSSGDTDAMLSAYEVEEYGITVEDAQRVLTDCRSIIDTTAERLHQIIMREIAIEIIKMM